MSAPIRARPELPRSSAIPRRAWALRPGTLGSSLCLHASLLVGAVFLGAGEGREARANLNLVVRLDSPAAETAPERAPEPVLRPEPVDLSPSPAEFEPEPTAPEPSPFVEPSVATPCLEPMPWSDLMLVDARVGVVVRPAPSEVPPPEPCPPVALPTVAAPAALVGPRPLEEENRPPSYPRESRLRGEEGSVGLALWIRCDGTVAEARVAKSSGRARLDRAALAAARGWRFAPATRDGVAIESGFEMDIEFRLRARD